MDFADTPEEAAFRTEVRSWLGEHLRGEFAELGGRGGPADETAWEIRVEWEKLLGKDRWLGLSWPEEYGGRAASFAEQVVFNEEYAKANAPARISFFGEGLFAPTLLAYGSDEQKRRFLPKIQTVEELWCQGYSEPNAGSDLANVQTRAELDGDEWVIDGQKVWTSLAHWADWCFVLCRTDRDAVPKHRGISYLLVPMRQPGIEIRPIVQITGTSEFNEVFFDGARTARENVVGEVNGGWKVAMGTLAFERGASTLGQQLGFENELRRIIEAGRANGRLDDPVMKQRVVDAVIALRIMRMSALRSMSAFEKSDMTPLTAVHKLYWATFHRNLGELAVDVLGPDALVCDGSPYELSQAQRLFVYSRADTIYGGSNQIQRNVIGERALGLPPEPKVEGR